jgi:predicted alpha/beta-hydrolase family hydrolase
VTRRVTRSVLEVETPTGPSRLHVSSVVRPRALVALGHGAGRGVDTDDLQSLAEQLPQLGVDVVLVDQPWVLAGRKVAAPPATLDLAWLAVLADLHTHVGVGRSVPLVVGGRSAGARVACRTAEETGARAVLLLAFPLLPPSARSSPERRAAALGVRTAEVRLPLSAGIPVVAAQGGRDAFGSAADLREALGDGVEVLEVTDADHALRVRRSGPDPAPTVLAAALRAVALARGE